uniref:Uncharacterized protein n=1 Tax=Acrobeloides nanus TaxID=290746 RepID=A0A914D378_9BILA
MVIAMEKAQLTDASIATPDVENGQSAEALIVPAIEKSIIQEPHLLILMLYCYSLTSLISIATELSPVKTPPLQDPSSGTLHVNIKSTCLPTTMSFLPL